MEWMNLPKEPAIVARQVVWVKMRSHPWWPAQVIGTRVLLFWGDGEDEPPPPPPSFAGACLVQLLLFSDGAGRGLVVVMVVV